MKLTQKLVRQFHCVENYPSASCFSQMFLPNKIQKIGWLMCEIWYQGCLHLGGWREIDWREKFIVQNCGWALVKPESQPGGFMLAL